MEVEHDPKRRAYSWPGVIFPLNYDYGLSLLVFFLNKILSKLGLVAGLISIILYFQFGGF